MRKFRSLAFVLVFATAALPTIPTPASTSRARIEPGVLQATGPLEILARFAVTVPADLASLPGVRVSYRFASVPAVFATATPDGVRALAAHPDLVYLERDKPIETLLDTATIASRARQVWDGDGAPLRDDQGRVVDGTGVGIAIVDTGLDGLHPDFQAPGKIGGNYEATPAGMVEAPFTSIIDGHGTHVAGIAAGNGEASGGEYRGAAPGATIYSFDAISGVSRASMAFDWILQNGAAQDPPIRVVNNSWRCSATSCNHPFNPDQLHIRLASELARNGIVVTWAAGNDRGDGDTATTNPEATNPTPGIIGVANYKDEEIGTRAGCLSGASAWGASADPATWPDVAAPGRSVTSTWAARPWVSGGSYSGRNPVNGNNTYHALTGTSMAAPHVAGIVALLFQVEPDLTPAEIEYIVKQTATPLVGPVGPGQDGCGIDYINADPAHPWNGANYAAGHGLVDAHAAVSLGDGFGEIPPLEPTVDPHDVPGFVVTIPGYRDEHTFYLVGEDGFTTAYPDAQTPRVRAQHATDPPIVHTSEPLPEAITFDAVKVDIYLGSTSEARDLFSLIGRATFVGIVERVAPDGSATVIAEVSRRNESGRTLGPVHRDLISAFAEPQTIPAGDRVRLTVRVVAPPYQGVEPAVNGFWDLYSESFTPSRVSFASRVASPAPGSREACERKRTCAQVDELHPYEGLHCDDVPFLLTWTGPPGSMLIYECKGVTIPCPVVVLPGEQEGTCELEVLNPIPTGADEGGACWYVLPNGGRGGSGRCLALARVD